MEIDLLKIDPIFQNSKMLNFRKDKPNLDLSDLQNVLMYFVQHVDPHEGIKTFNDEPGFETLLVARIYRDKVHDKSMNMKCFSLEWAHSMKNRPTEKYLTLKALQNANLSHGYSSVVDHDKPFGSHFNILLGIMGRVAIEMKAKTTITDQGVSQAGNKTHGEKMESYDALIYMTFATK